MSDAAATLSCRFCGATPAIKATVHEHHGMIIMMRHVTYRGPFCRDCGLKAVKRGVTRTATLGWWGVISLFLGTPFSLIADLVAWLRIRALPAPVMVTPMSQVPAPSMAPPTPLAPPAPPAPAVGEQSAPDAAAS